MRETGDADRWFWGFPTGGRDAKTEGSRKQQIVNRWETSGDGSKKDCAERAGEESSLGREAVSTAGGSLPGTQRLTNEWTRQFAATQAYGGVFHLLVYRINRRRGIEQVWKKRKQAEEGIDSGDDKRKEWRQSRRGEQSGANRAQTNTSGQQGRTKEEDERTGWRQEEKRREEKTRKGILYECRKDKYKEKMRQTTRI